MSMRVFLFFDGCFVTKLDRSELEVEDDIETLLIFIRNMLVVAKSYWKNFISGMTLCQTA